jgi:hypothetical protein
MFISGTLIIEAVFDHKVIKGTKKNRAGFRSQPLRQHSSPFLVFFVSLWFCPQSRAWVIDLSLISIDSWECFVL